MKQSETKTIRASNVWNMSSSYTNTVIYNSNSEQRNYSKFRSLWLTLRKKSKTQIINFQL